MAAGLLLVDHYTVKACVLVDLSYLSFYSFFRKQSAQLLSNNIIIKYIIIRTTAFVYHFSKY